MTSWKNIFFTALLASFVTEGKLSATPFSQRSMIDIPTAYILPHSRVNIASNMYLPLPNGSTQEVLAYMGLYDHSEIGLALPLVNQKTNGKSSPFLFLHAKYQIFGESRIFPAMAVGFVNIGTDGKLVDTGSEIAKTEGYVKDYQSNSLFFVLSKQMLVRPIYDRLLYFDFHAGMGIRRFVGDWFLSKAFHGIFGGIDLYITDKLNIMFEMDGNDFNFGFQYAFNRLNIRMAWAKIEELPFKDVPVPNIGFGVQWNMGPFWGKQKDVKKLYNAEDKRAFLMKGALDIHENTLNLILQMNKLKSKRQELEGKLRGLKDAVEQLKEREKSDEETK